MNRNLTPQDVMFLKSMRIVPPGEDAAVTTEMERLDEAWKRLGKGDAQIMGLMDYADGERLDQARARNKWMALAWIFAFAAGVLLVVNVVLVIGGVR